MEPQDGRIVSNFILQALKNEDITIYGMGKQTRPFYYVDDLISGMIKMMNSIPELLEPVNIGNPSEFTILQLAEKVIELVGSESKIIFCNLPKDDSTQRKPDIQLAKNYLINYDYYNNELRENPENIMMIYFFLLMKNFRNALNMP